MRRRHWLLASVFALLPLAGESARAGSSALRWAPAFTMYASVVEFRLAMSGHANGRTLTLSPTSLAPALPSSAQAYVAGADHFRRTSDVAPLRSHLDDLGRVACRRMGMLDDVDVVLFERIHGDIRQTSVRVACVR